MEENAEKTDKTLNKLYLSNKNISITSLAELNLPIFHAGPIFAILIVSIYYGIAGMPVLIRRLKDNPSARSVSEKFGYVFNGCDGITQLTLLLKNRLFQVIYVFHLFSLSQFHHATGTWYFVSPYQLPTKSLVENPYFHMFNGKDRNPDKTICFPFRNSKILIAVPRSPIIKERNAYPCFNF